MEEGARLFSSQISIPTMPGATAVMSNPISNGNGLAYGNGGNYIHSNNGEEIRTLYVVGLPDDIRERELRNLFRFYPTYRGCMLSEKKGKYGGTLAFALFENKAAALEAKAVLDNTPFDQADPDGPKLSLHLAKKNINPRMLRESRLLTQQSLPSSYGIYNGHYAPQPPSWSATQAGRAVHQGAVPMVYGAPTAAIGGPLSSGSASSFLGLDVFDAPQSAAAPTRPWHDLDVALNLQPVWTPPPPLSSPQAIRGAADHRRTRGSQDLGFSSSAGSSAGTHARQPTLPTSC